MQIKKYIPLFSLLASVLLTTACGEDLFPKEEEGDTPQMRTITTQIHPFQINGEDASLPGEGKIDDIQACLFEDGILTEIYTPITKENEQFVFQTEKKKGHFYIVGNVADQVNLQELKAQGITEDKWLKTTLTQKNEEAHDAEFFSGMLDLGKNNGNTLLMDMERGVARFDLAISASSSIKVEKITLQHISPCTYLFSQNPAATPDDTVLEAKTIEFPKALETSTQGITYLYEQTGTDLTAILTLQKNGQPITIETSLPAIVKRNAVYVLNLSTNPVTGTIKVDVIEWENGGDHTLSSEAGSLKVNTQTSSLPGNVSVTEERNRIILPYTATELTLAVDCDDELEFIPDNIPLTVETLGGIRPETTGKNLFRIQKERWRLGVPGEEIKLRFHRKGLNQTYPDDFLTLVLTENPTHMEGLLNYNEGYEYDFGRYVDNVLTTLTLPETKTLTVEYENGEDPWIRLDAQEETPNSFRVLGGWKPNDPTADGRMQKAKLVICNHDGSEKEEYTVIRRNWGLPVTYFNGVWWCKYNAMGNSKDFNDQILSSSDPAVKAGKSLFDYLRDCTAEEFFNLWKWQYQGKTTQGMQVIDDGGTAKLEGYGTSSAHINKLAPTAMAPEGYELPSLEEFDRVLKITNEYLWLMWDGGHNTAWNGGTNIQRRQRRRNDVTVGTVALNDLIYIAMYSNGTPSQNEPLVWYGPATQWDNNGIKHGHYNNMLWATYSPNDGQGWYFSGAMNAYYAARNGAGPNDTRLLRFKKSDVEYIYE